MNRHKYLIILILFILTHTAFALDEVKPMSGYGILNQLQLADKAELNGNFQEAEKVLTDLQLIVIKSIPQTKTQNYFLEKNVQTTYFDAYDQIGFFYLSMGNAAKAKEVFEQSLTLRKKYFQSKSIHLVRPIMGFGSCEFRNKNYDKAYSYFNEAFNLVNKATTTNYNFDNVTKIAYNDITEICIRLKKFKEAEKYLELLAVSVTASASTSGSSNNNNELGRIFEIKSRYYLAQNNYPKATYYVNKARKFLNSTNIRSNVSFKVARTEAAILWAQKDYVNAADVFIQLVTNYQQYIKNSFSSLSTREQELFYRSFREDIDLFNSFVLHIIKQNVQGKEALLKTLFENQLRTKEIMLSSSSELRKNVLASNDPALLTVLNDWEKAKTILSSVYYKKGMQYLADSLTKRVERLEKVLVQKAKIDLTKQEDFTIARITSKLKDKEAAVEVVRVMQTEGLYEVKQNPESVAYLFAVCQRGESNIQAILVENGSSLENRFVKYYRNAILTQQTDNLSYDNFWRPVKEKLSSFKKIYFTGDGVYAQVNLNTLFNPINKKFLIDEIEINYLTNTTELLKSNLGNDQKNLAILLGRPRYSEEKTESGKFRSLINEELSSFTDQDFSDLPGTEAEVKAISKTLTNANWQVALLTDSKANEKSIKEVKSPTVLHLATHGFFIPDSSGTVNPMIRSGLVLSGIKSSSQNEDDDGILTALEATSLNLTGTKLVILSACNTGIGESKNGEGVYGLQRAFILAGTQNLLMSLWKVDDQATQELMTLFYAAWTKNNNPLLAFISAQIDLRKKYNHPFYWGAFLMLGTDL